ncbi:MAG: hypothetical protein HYY03_00235 [Chloroflexi bacterium]|nr:hypothetical protein [Chloroflexota bacterium]
MTRLMLVATMAVLSWLGCTAGTDSGPAPTTSQTTDGALRDASEEEKLILNYVEDLYGRRYSSREDAAFAVAEFWADKWDSQLKRVEYLGYAPFALRPLCAVASTFPFRHIRLRQAESFTSFVAEESLLVEVVQLTTEEVERLLDDPSTIYVDRAWCDNMAEQIRVEFNDLPAP